MMGSRNPKGIVGVRVIKTTGSRCLRSSPLLVLLLASLFCLALSGCDIAGESEYEKQIRLFKERAREWSNEFERTGQQMYSELEEELASATDASTVLTGLNKVVNSYMPALHQYVAELNSIKADMTGLKPPEKYKNAHRMYTSGMESFSISIAEMVRGIGLLANYSTISQGISIIEAAQGYADKGISSLEEGDKIVGASNWAVLLGIPAAFAGFVVVVLLVLALVSRGRRGSEPSRFDHASCGGSYPVANVTPPV